MAPLSPPGYAYDQFIEEHGFDWIKCESLAAHGAAAMSVYSIV